MFDITSEKSTELLNKMVDFTALKQKVIANNIANVNTPGYQRLDVSFDKNLKDVMKNEEPINEIKLEVVNTDNESLNVASRNDGNTVDIDKEVSELMQNYLMYNIYLELMAKKFRMLNRAMRSR